MTDRPRMRLHHEPETTAQTLFKRARRLNQVTRFGYEMTDFLMDIMSFLAALPPSPAVVPSGWKLVPVVPTEAMTKAGFGPFLAAHDPFFNKNEPTAPIYRAMLSASPSPPALDGAGRDAVIEECATAVIAEASKPHMDGCSVSYALDDFVAAIRSIKETP